MTSSVSLGSLLLLALLVFPSTTTAQPAIGFQYAVKFICGKADGRFLAPGVYFTAINVHNPSRAVSSFLKKVAIALPGERTGRVSPFFEARLQADEALEIECPDILQHAQSTDDFLKGFVVLQSRAEFDVVAVYTAAGATGQVETLHLERVSPRTLRLQRGSPRRP